MFRRLVVPVVLIAVALGAAAPSFGVTVKLRVEGVATTLFEGTLETAPHTVEGRTCDGTNGGANPSPGPTMTGALDDSGISWDGTWFDSFQDFSVDRIGPDASDLVDSRFWGLVLNYQQTQVGGCQQQVGPGDEVLFAYDLFSKTHVLRLASTKVVATTGELVTLTVVDGQNGQAVGGASVAGATTAGDGTATVSWGVAGGYPLKAQKADSVRSNRIDVCVYDPAVGGCGVPAPAVGSVTPPPAPADSPLQPLPGSEAGAETPVSSAACVGLTVSPRPLKPQVRTRLRIESSDARVLLRIRGPGIDRRTATDETGVATLAVRPSRSGTIRIGVIGQIDRCGQERIRVRE